MSKVGYVLLGIALTIGALSLGSYRHLWKPQRERAVVTETNRPAARSAPAAQQQRLPAKGQPPASQPAATSEISTAQMFDWGLNIANLIVGAVGIWLAVSGMRRRA